MIYNNRIDCTIYSERNYNWSTMELFSVKEKYLILIVKGWFNILNIYNIKLELRYSHRKSHKGQ